MKWFKHLSQSHTDEKLADLLSECGLEGYGFWWLLMEVVANQCVDDKCCATYTLPHWSRLLYSHHNKVGKYLGKLVVIGIVTVESVEGKVRVTIPNLLKYRDEYSRKSVQKPEIILPKKEKEKEKEIKKENIEEDIKTVAVSVKPKRPSSVKLSDEEWTIQMKENPAYNGIDIDTEIHKCQAWCMTKGKVISRARILNWLNRSEKPFTGNIQTSQGRVKTFADHKEDRANEQMRQFVEGV